MTAASIALAEALAAQPKPNKYRNKPVTVDGIRFASQREAKRYGELKLMERAGAIRELKLQHRFPLVVEGVKVCTYVADLTYVRTDSFGFVVEDAKGVRTDVFKIKKALMKAVYGLDVVEV